MDRTQLSKVRRVAVVAVLSNLVVLAALAALLPAVLLPLAALGLPLITAGVLEAVAEPTPARSAREPQPRGLARVSHGLPHAA